MLEVEILPIDGSTLVLRARGSELLILPDHVHSLKVCKTPKEFVDYFMNEALLNRSARKLYEAWLRKDRTLWKRIFTTVMKEMSGEAGGDAETPKAKIKADAKPAKVSAAPQDDSELEKKSKKVSKKAEEPAPEKVVKKGKDADKPKAKELAKKPAAKKAEAPAKAKKAAAEPAKKSTKDTKKAAPAKAKKKG